MYTEIISTDKLEEAVLEAISHLSRQTADGEIGKVSPAAQDLGTKFRHDFIKLQQIVDSIQQLENTTEENGLELSGEKRFAAMIVSTVAKVQQLSPGYPLAVLQSQDLVAKRFNGDLGSNASRGITSPQTLINTSGWNGRSWHNIAKDDYVPTKNSYHEFVGNFKDVFLDFLQDGIKETLTKEITDAAFDGVQTVLSLVLGQSVVLALAQTPLLLFTLGTVLLFLLRYAQTNAVNVPEDCACVWNHIRIIYASKGVVSPENVIRVFRELGQLHPRPYNLAPCDTVSQQQVTSCPFRYSDQQGKSCCKLAYDDDISFGLENRDDKVVRTFQKLERLGLLETRIDSSPTDYFLK